MKIIENEYRSYTSNFEKTDDYYEEQEKKLSDYTDISQLKKAYIDMLEMKNHLLALYDRRLQCTEEIIEIIAHKIGIDPSYCVYIDRETGVAGSPLANKIDELLSKSGDKVKLKKRNDELENENSVLRSLVGVT